MQCEYIGLCASCTLGDKTYEEQLKHKVQIQKDRFKIFYKNDIDIIKSDDGKFRNRAEFKIWKTFDENNEFKLNYAMNDIHKKALPIQSCSIVTSDISILMPKLILRLQQNDDLNFKLFSCEFLSSTIHDTLVTLIYHKKLDDIWISQAKILEKELNIKIIGRSRKQKIILSDDFINEELKIQNSKFKIQYKEGGFTQPNQKVNQQMISWVIHNCIHKDDLCELYCGGGNFTIPLSKYFDNILATEISKTSIKSAKINCKLNSINNIKFIRMSSEEFVEARLEKREFRRLLKENVYLKDYNFSTIFVDPPRAGLDDTTTALSKEFEQIIYISCNPETLHRDLLELTKTHTIKCFALFDQFAFTSHIECGIILDIK